MFVGYCGHYHRASAGQLTLPETPRRPPPRWDRLGQTVGGAGTSLAQSLTLPSPPKGVGCPGKGASTGCDPADRRPPAAWGVCRHREGWADVSTWLGAGGNQPAVLGHSVSPGVRALLRDMGVTTPSTVGTRRLAGQEVGELPGTAVPEHRTDRASYTLTRAAPPSRRWRARASAGSARGGQARSPALLWTAICPRLPATFCVCECAHPNPPSYEDTSHPGLRPP